MDKIKNAIISVYEKNELENLAKELEKNDISIISSGGTFQALQKAGIKAQRVSDLTQFPEIDLDTNKVGIFGQIAKLDKVVFEGDRVEIYRPITADPDLVGLGNNEE